MEYSLSTVVVSAASIAIVVMVFGAAYMYATSMLEAPLISLQEKMREVGAALGSVAGAGAGAGAGASAGAGSGAATGGEGTGTQVTVYGIYTGKLIMRCQDVDPFVIGVSLSGKAEEVAARKVALSVSGLSMAVPPSSNFTTRPPSVKITCSGNATLALPVLSISYIGTEALMGSKVHLVTAKVPLFTPSNFTASGLFNLRVWPAGREYRYYLFRADWSGECAISVDGEQALSLSVRQGDNIEVLIEYVLVEVGKG